ncbi:hypothetical protein DEU56DRAFT_917110 [Suillus clintonianus]|uniref:uncharacterized protein n=1 Tax=Suillus clintonianus TaxID=1904413 RepID=UPI001B86B671|nr:uncharacterized protein DEU56DRAFT_917110 [Suillus clintonianus]KAG2124238.1 hypothetical protein DEU56DRAFT_917110 [Suillus clintonianus]
MQSVLEARLVHQCLDIVLEPLKQAARIGRMMSDPLGNLRYCFTPLASYIVDTPEACMLACVRGKTSPITMAMYENFGDAFQHSPRTAKMTLDQLSSISCDPLDVEGYFNACAPFRLSGVAQPFWRDWSLADPHVFFTPEPLHHWHREFYDHDVKWCLAAVGEQELDFRFSVSQPLTTFRHFKRHDRRSALSKILGALEEFHEHKQEIIACGARRGAKSKQVLDNWHIPKLELMQSVEPSIRQDPADSSNNINYDAQICRFLDRREKCRNFQIATSIIARSQSQSQASTSRMTDASSEHHDESHDEDPHADKSNLQTGLDDLWGPKRVVTDFFKKAEQLSSDIEVARPLRTFVVVDVVAEKFSLPDLRGALADYIQREGMAQNVHSLRGQRRALPDAPLPFNDLMVWFKVRVQQASYHSPSITPPALTVNAHPPSATWKYGRYDAAIFTVDDTGREQWPTSGLKGHDVVEVHLIMQPLPPQGKPGSAPWATRFLTYVQRLDVMPQRHGSLLECTTQMHVLKRAMRSAGTPFGDILPLDQLRSFAQIIPRFGRVADSRLTAQNSAHFAQTFFLNKYINKDFYYAISN